MSLKSDLLLRSSNLAPTDKIRINRHFNSMKNALMQKDDQLKEAKDVIRKLKNQEGKEINLFEVENLVKTATVNE